MQITTIFIQNNKKQLLIQKRSEKKGGKYGITSGHTLIGEDAKKGAIREVKEELGLDINEKELQLIYQEEQKSIIYNLYFITKEIKLESLSLQKEEVENVYWCTIEEIKNLIRKNEFYDKQIEAFKIFERHIEEEF